ncbi:MAG TPA: bifunctional 5,10-methylenetetrahydrofolate dehydrogenase/5,10-methenyltetrahydrofolate cyclohydrolase [Ktedonobacterales bacterium]|jgi:methylenetetrahydrofolate dehydrogenase (NADP+)/methenyltetrahydrofolate cyclohydrolase|nr:bifunctional 5,10-methylenetetrahydrofolate dehydrogenase/5,10-methenyltetrahydrofolate cyclohydrolase [Ktedonobacterales bacterium]
MPATLLDGRVLAGALREQLTTEATRFARERGHRPALALVGAGDDATAALYAGQVVRSCVRIGLDCSLHRFPPDVAERELRDAVAALGERDDVRGVVLLLPLPAHIRQRVVTEALAPEKDIDGLGPRNAGRLMLGFPSYVPSTADAALELLRDAGIALRGQNAVILGRGNVGGKPAALLFLREEATITICHSQTPNMADLTRQADIIFASTGRPGTLTADMVRPGAVVLDAGMNALEGRVVGDVDFAGVRQVAGAISPVPGGLGPLTNLMLIRHALLGPT